MMEGNLLPFCKMKRKMLIGQALLLVMMSHLASSMNGQSLTCYNDCIDILTCEWNSSVLESRLQITPDNCSLKAICDDLIQKQTVQSDLRPLHSWPELRTATLKFAEECLLDGGETLPVFVECGGTTVDKIDKFSPSRNVKLYPPENLWVNGSTVLWMRGTPHSRNVYDLKFQLQYKTLEQSWEEVKLTDLLGTQCLLPNHELVLGKKYEVRVRSMPVYSGRFWSDWSPATQWTSTDGQPPHPDPNPNEMMLWLTPGLTGTVVLIIIVLIFLAVCRFHPIKWSLKPQDMRNPFDDLYHQHGGDFKSWVGAFVGPESLFKAEIERISAVEICKVQTLDNPNKMDVGKRKSFTNSTYFLSQSSKCTVADQLEPCSEQCPYGPAGGGSVEEKTLLTAEVSHSSDTENEGSVSGPLETSSSYKHLQKLRLDVQSPDSGFAAGSDQDSQEESGSEGLPSPPVVDNILPISSVLPCPIPKIPHVTGFPNLQFFPSPGFGWSPPDPSLQQIFSIIDCSEMVQPSDEDYMPIKKVQE
ncbi:uncharacterized protein [Salminus brasiliensis]|uniref:uncharacterized protein isoform X2 n=1 Tax=Salminus brasiliensis TaxID=930266 RepID=UPI003B8305C5